MGRLVPQGSATFASTANARFENSCFRFSATGTYQFSELFMFVFSYCSMLDVIMFFIRALRKTNAACVAETVRRVRLLSRHLIKELE